MSIRAGYLASISDFLKDSPERILGVLTAEHHHALEEPQRWAWTQEISILRWALSSSHEGLLCLELYIPRMGKRADAALILKNLLVICEFKIGAVEYASSAFDQVEDYALDL